MGLMLRRMCMMGASAIPTPPLLKTVSGAILHITDALAKPAKKLVVEMNPVQDLHGYDNPWPAGGGVNKLDPSQTMLNTNSIYGLATSWSTDGVLTLIGTWKGSTSSSARVLDVPSAVRSLNVKSFESSGHISLRWQSGENRIVADCGNMVNGNSYNLTVYPIVYEGSTAPTSWTPYENICPITEHTGANVVRTGKNLYDKVNHPFESYSGRTDVCWTSPIFLKKGTYTFTCNDGFGRCYLNVYGTFNDAVNNVNRISQNSFTSDSSRTDTFTSDVYIRYQQNTVTGSFADVSNAWQTEIGSSATTYEPYTGTTIPITFPDAAGTVYGGTLTINEDGSGEITIANGDVTFNGNSSEVWSAYPNGSGFSIGISGMASRNRGAGVCDRFKILTASDGSIASAYGVALGLHNNSAYFVGITTHMLDVTDVTTWKTWLANNPVTVIYPLATPITYTLTSQQVLTLLKGENNVWCDGSDDLELTYYAKAEETP